MKGSTTISIIGFLQYKFFNITIFLQRLVIYLQQLRPKDAIMKYKHFGSMKRRRKQHTKSSMYLYNQIKLTHFSNKLQFVSLHLLSQISIYSSILGAE